MNDFQEKRKEKGAALAVTLLDVVHVLDRNLQRAHKCRNIPGPVVKHLGGEGGI